MNKAEIDAIKMRRAYMTVHDIMSANDIEYPFAIIWQTIDDDGNEDFTTMCERSKWNDSHGPNGATQLRDIVNASNGR